MTRDNKIQNLSNLKNQGNSFQYQDQKPNFLKLSIVLRIGLL